jgi:glycosidase
MWNLVVPSGKRIAVCIGLASFGLVASLTGPVTADSYIESLAAPSLRSPIAGDNFYFVMTDRYRDGDPSNNTGGATGGRTQTGYDPASDSFYHGGDLAGLTGNCDVSDLHDHGLARIKRLGFTAIWITPPFVQRTVQGSSASYHGYWFLDLSRPDPHLGTEQDFANFVACAKRLNIKVFLDVVVNHTADVITFKQGYGYVSLKKSPYRTASGKVFNPWNYTSGTRFPQLSRTKSFAKTPTIEPDYINSKFPAILNDVTKYHNRGDISWGSCVGRCEMDGDFSGLDDIMTEDWAVIKALAEAYGSWINKYGIDGFRLDTAKHTDPYFFGRWLPLIAESAQAAGIEEFTSFGEVWITDAAQLAEQMHLRKLPSVLDFPYQDAARKFASKRATGGTIAALFEEDDYYTTASTNAYGLTTFLGNHDMGRIGFFIRADSGATGQELTERHLFAHDFLYLTRGIPVVYYGDEVGMIGTGDGKDKRARQDMFPTQVQDWKTQERVSTPPIGDASSFEESTVIESRIRELSDLREAHPALATGSQITRFGQGDIFIASRIDAQARIEYVIAFNSGNTSQTVEIQTSTPLSDWDVLSGLPQQARTESQGSLKLTLPARSTVVLKSQSSLPVPERITPTVSVKKDYVTGKYEVSAKVTGTDPLSITFLKKTSQGWVSIGTDDAPPYRVFTPPVKGETTQFAAVVSNSIGAKTSALTKRISVKPFL